MKTETSIVVRPGDTLSALAAAHLGSARAWRDLYRVNAETITAAQRAYPDARLAKGMCGPDWIFPGTRLVVPRIAA